MSTRLIGSVNQPHLSPCSMVHTHKSSPDYQIETAASEVKTPITRNGCQRCDDVPPTTPTCVPNRLSPLSDQSLPPWRYPSLVIEIKSLRPGSHSRHRSQNPASPPSPAPFHCSPLYINSQIALDASGATAATSGASSGSGNGLCIQLGQRLDTRTVEFCAPFGKLPDATKQQIGANLP